MQLITYPPTKTVKRQATHENRYLQYMWSADSYPKYVSYSYKYVRIIPAIQGKKMARYLKIYVQNEIHMKRYSKFLLIRKMEPKTTITTFMPLGE